MDCINYHLRRRGIVPKLNKTIGTVLAIVIGANVFYATINCLNTWTAVNYYKIL